MEISRLGQTWTKYKPSKVQGNLVMDGGFNYDFDNVSGY